MSASTIDARVEATPPLRVVASGLRFPEGPLAQPDGSILFVEVQGGTLSRVPADGGAVNVVAELCPGGYGGANSVAIGPDGAAYVCNNGGFFWSDRDGILMPFNAQTGENAPPRFDGGWIDRVDLATGEHRVLYRECSGQRFVGPNDLVFDSTGGFWFTDHGKVRADRWEKGGVYYAAADGSSVTRAIFPLSGPNGVGLSPDESTLYVAETNTGRLWAFDLDAPGRVRPAARGHGGRCVANTVGHLDSLAVEADGTVCVAAISQGILVVPPDGAPAHYVAMPDFACTNLCFGGADLRTAFVTLSGSGQLVAVDWPRPGLALCY
jgi:gluconolactonase